MRVGIYVRVSTQEQAMSGYSIAEQTDRATKYCEAMRWDEHQVFTDAGYSGAYIDRPALQSLISAVRAKHLDKVIVYKLDRLSRSQKDTLMLIEDIFLANGCDFISISENFDTASAFGKAMIGMLAVFAQLEREQIRERMSMGREARAKKGLYHGSSFVPIGYDYADGKLIVNEYEKLQVLDIYSMYIRGYTPYSIAKSLNDRGLTHKYGRWSGQAVNSVIGSRAYCGFIRHHGSWLQGVHEPIISEETYDAAQVIRANRCTGQRQNRRDGKVTSYLTNLLVCAECGQHYVKATKMSGTHRYDYYMCATRRSPSNYSHRCSNKTWKMSDLDDLVFGEIRKLAMDACEESAPPMIPDRTAAIESEIAKLDAQIAKLIDLYALDKMPMDMLGDKLSAANDRKARLQQELMAEERLNETAIRTAIESFSDILDKGSFQEIRATISLLIERIDVAGDDITIHWAFS